ncbi:MAG: DinB family protein, partial [Rubricoccaceae bacterium]|nr:DinB family protein [Rubricoccaceae bacterium]
PIPQRYTMKRNTLLKTICLTVLVAAWTLPVSAQGSNAEVIGLINMAEEKVASLAEAMDDEQWAYRPMEGVRSTSEVFMHIAAANYFIPSLMGVAPPEDFPVTMGPEGPVGMEEYEAISDREEVTAELADSFDHVRAALDGVPADRMDDEMNVFGMTMTVRGFCIFIGTHLHEHLGQLVAYARANEVVPPWSASEGG